MGISQQIGASSLSKPGVCTSSTRPATPYEGQMIYETDTDLSYIYGNSAWQQIAGSTAVGNSGLVYVTSATIGTGVSSVTVSSAFSSTYDNYKIIVSGGVASTNCDLNLIMGSTTSGYAYSLVYVNIVNSTVNGESSTTATKFPYFGGGSANSLYGVCELLSPNLAKFTGMSSFYNQMVTNGATGTMHAFLANTTQYTAFTFSPHSGTITGGTVTVYGYRKS